MSSRDSRMWVDTDRPGETLCIAEPLLGVQMMSVRGSTRHWTEVHSTVTLAAVRPAQPGVVARWRTRARDLETAAGAMMAIQPGDVHVTKSVSAPADFDLVKLPPEVVDEVVQTTGGRGAFRFRSPSCEDALVMDAFQSLTALHAQGAVGLELESAYADLLDTTVARLGESTLPPGVVKDPVSDYRLRRVREFLRDNLSSKPSLDQLARETGISKFWLCATFRSAFGVSVGQYWAAARIAEATRRLRSGASIRRVTSELGYADEPLFNRTFKRHWGCPPGAWLAARARNSPRLASPTR